MAAFGDRLDRVMTERTAHSRRARLILGAVAFVLPFVLGLGAALMGGHAMKLIERDTEKWGGNFEAVFAIMIGGLATMAPERRDDVVSLGFKSIVSGTLSTCLIGAIVGMLT